MSLQVIESAVVTAPGLYRMSSDRYHAGPCPAPELSASICKILIDKSPLHAWTAHAKFGNAPVEEGDEEEGDEPKASNVQDFGSAVHRLALGYGADIVVVNPLDHIGPKGGVPKGWTNASIKQARADARGAGKIPLLTKHHARARNTAESLSVAVEAYLGCRIADCLREVVVCWQEQDESGDFWCKSMLDLVTPDLRKPLDLKSTGVNVSPGSFGRFIYSQGYYIQAAFYLRALDAIDPDGAGRREFPFFGAETNAPFATSRPTIPTEAGLTAARMKIDVAMQTWARCLAANDWPAFGNEPHYAEPPSYLLYELGNDFQ